MARAPVAGRVKTRLARDVGVAEATRFARHSLTALLARLAPDPRWRLILAITPDVSLADRVWQERVAVIPQGRGDLGQRMQRLFDARPRGPLVIVGTDIPAVTPAHIAHAFRLLGRHDAVLGPADDGGYWLIGLRRRPRVLRPFAGVRWSGPNALADTRANLARSSVGLLARLSDVDSAADLARARPLLGRRILPRG